MNVSFICRNYRYIKIRLFLHVILIILTENNQFTHFEKITEADITESGSPIWGMEAVFREWSRLMDRWIGRLMVMYG